MTNPRESRPHPGEGEKRLSVSDGNLDSSSVARTDRPRCVICGHAVWHPLSVSTGMGRECRRKSHQTAAAVTTDQPSAVVVPVPRRKTHQAHWQVAMAATTLAKLAPAFNVEEFDTNRHQHLTAESIDQALALLTALRDHLRRCPTCGQEVSA